MKQFIYILGMILMFVGATQADSLFRWKDKDGKVHYGDKPAEDAVGAEQKKFSAVGAAGEDELPYSLRKAKQDFPVTLYTAANCGEACLQATTLLGKRGVPYAEKKISTNEDAVAFKKLSGGNSVPVLMVGKSILNGFEAGQWNSELDIAGYPKTAPYGVKTTPAVVNKADAPAPATGEK
jgi:glutaredoxin